MRNELEQSQLIDRYLDGNMNAEEKVQFEEKMTRDDVLRQEVIFQSQLQDVIFQQGIREQAVKAYRIFKRNKIIIRLSTIALILLMLTFLIFSLFSDSPERKQSNDQPKVEKAKIVLPNTKKSGVYEPDTTDINGKVSKDSLSDSIIEAGQDHFEVDENGNFVDDSLNSESNDQSGFQIEPEKFRFINGEDNVFETKSGLVLVMPESGFLNQNNEVVDGTVELEVIEVTTPSDIMKMGLSTTSHGNELVTGGMYHFQAFQGGKRLKINPGDPILADFPEVKNDNKMMLFDGKKAKDGSINWTNPKQLENWLTPVDILSLNFYPPGYLAQANAMELVAGNKKYTDSLYYAFEYDDLLYLDSIFPEYLPCDFIYYHKLEDWESESDLVKETSRNLSNYGYIGMLDTTGKANRKSLRGCRIKGLPESFGDKLTTKGIYPSKIKTIWNPKYNGTNLATKEFEDRIPLIHKTCNNSVLDIYIQNLDKNLSYCDSLAANIVGQKLKEQFLNFAKLGHTRVRLDSKQAELLAEYYKNKQTENSKLILNEQKEYWDQQAKQDIEAIEKINEYNAADRIRQNKLQLEELGQTLNEKVVTIEVVSGSVIGITSFGWKNKDYYRNTSSSFSSKEPPIIAKNASVISINNSQIYDEIRVYFLADELSSFNRAYRMENNFTFKRNREFKYDLFVLAFVGDQKHIFMKKNITELNFEVNTLQEVTDHELETALKPYEFQMKNDLKNDIDFFIFRRDDDIRRAHNLELKSIRRRLEPTVFPCIVDRVNVMKSMPKDNEGGKW